MKKTYWRYILAIILFLLVASQSQNKNPSSSSTPTIPQPTPVPTSILGTTSVPTSPSAMLENRAPATIVKVVDGDTVQVTINGTRETLRIIGINTPETVDPRRPVECFGSEASDKAKTLLPAGKIVQLEQDHSQSNRDRYGRLLRYIFFDRTDYGIQMISEGYAFEYTYDNPYKYQSEYKAAQISALQNRKGLWNDQTCPSTN